MRLMLSFPFLLSIFLETTYSNRDSHCQTGLLISFIKKLHIFSSDFVSQIPSHPRRKNSKVLSSFPSKKDGMQETICLLKGSVGFFLKLKSPSALDKLSLLLILPFITFPPAATILSLS